jgi:hypothetical protein
MSLFALFLAVPIFLLGFMAGAKWTRFKYGVSKSTSKVKKGFTDLFKKKKIQDE